MLEESIVLTNLLLVHILMTNEEKIHVVLMRGSVSGKVAQIFRQEFLSRMEELLDVSRYMG